MRNALLGLILSAQLVSGSDGPLPSPSELYQTLIHDWEAYLKRAEKEASEATTEAAKERFTEENQRFTHSVGKRAIELARSHPEDPAALDSLLWVVHHGYSPETTEGWKGLISDHLASDRLTEACRDTRRDVIANPTLIDQFLREAVKTSPHREVQGQACFALAIFLNFRAEAMRNWSEPDRAWAEGLLKTSEKLSMYRDRSPDDLTREAEGLYERVISDFADLKDRRGRLLGERSKGELNELRSLGVGKVAPDIEGEDADGRKFKLSDYRGKVVVLTFSGNWCGPCRVMYPEERDMVKRLEGKPFALLSVNTDEDRATLSKSIESGEVTWRCWWDGPPGGVICTRWGIEGFPTVHVLDHRGVIRYRNLIGEDLKKAVESLMKEINQAKP